MAEIFVDGRILDPMMDSRRSLRSAYAELQQATVLQGRLIAQVKLDHEDIGWNDPKIDWDEPLSNFQVFSIRTVSPTVLAEQVLTSMIQAAHPASSIHRQVADLYRSPNTVDAKQRLAHIINWWQQQLDGLSQLRNLDRLIREIEPSAATIEHSHYSTWRQLPAKLEPIVTRLRRRLVDLVEMLDTNDPILVADTLEFELAPLCDDYVTQLKAA